MTVWDDEDPVERLETVLGGPVPFRPLERLDTWHEEGTMRTYSGWRWFCTWLMPDGRCGNYEIRPQLCRDYQPLADGLCVHYNGGTESGDPTFDGVADIAP